ncbi:MAG: putative rane protein [Betaproteobacteria bacterium]|nr:putative rane protein [Betaproteobacteria bacterium]
MSAVAAKKMAPVARPVPERAAARSKSSVKRPSASPKPRSVVSMPGSAGKANKLPAHNLDKPRQPLARNAAIEAGKRVNRDSHGETHAPGGNMLLAGNLAVQCLLRSSRIQAKLSVSDPSDPDEVEADRIADRVLDLPLSAKSNGRASTKFATAGRFNEVQMPAAHQTSERISASEPYAPPSRRNGEAEEKIRRKVVPGQRKSALSNPSSESLSLSTGGQPLPPRIRSDFEQRFATDFSGVRVHADNSAAESARAIQAKAYTAGEHVVFGKNEFSPTTKDGRRLLAHELAHVVQQTSAGVNARINRAPDSAGMTSGTAPASVPAGASTASQPTASIPAEASRKNKELVEKALKSKKSGDVQDIKNFYEVSEEDKFKLIRIVLDQTWVGPNDEYALEDIWKSFGDRLVSAASSFIGLALWEASVEAGAELEDLPKVKELRDAFTPDVVALATRYLDQNDALVVSESQAAGIPLGDAPQSGAPAVNQEQQMLAMKSAAASVAHAQEEMDRARQVYVGYSLGHVGLESKQYWIPVTFDPFHPPERAAAPVVDLNDPSPMADHHPVHHPQDRPVNLQSYGEMLNAYQLGIEGIRALVTKHPLIYAITREGKSETTQSFAQADPAVARKQLAAALNKLRGDITQAKAKLGNALNPLDLTLLHEQLYNGIEATSKTNWALALPRKLAKGLTQGHDNDKALKALGLEAVSQMAFMIGGVVPGVGGVAASIVGLVATSAKAGMSAEQYKAMLLASKVAVKPGTDLVTPAQVDEAKAQNDADQAALLLAILNTAAAIASTAGGWAAKRIAESKVGAPNASAGKSKSIVKVPSSKPVQVVSSGDTIELGSQDALAPGPPPKPKFVWRIISDNPETGDCLGVVVDPANNSNGIFRINRITGDGIVYSGGKTRVVKGGELQPEVPLLNATNNQAPPTSTAPAALPPGPSEPPPKALPGANLPGLPPAGGFENAFPAQQPAGLAAEPNIGKFYPGMRQLPAGYPAYDHVRGGTATVKFTVESLGTPKTKQTVMNISIEGGEWLSDKTQVEGTDATPDYIDKVVKAALKDMNRKSGRKAEYDPAHDWYVRIEPASPERAILHIQVRGEARAAVESLQRAAEQAVVNSTEGPGVPVEVRVMSWR